MSTLSIRTAVYLNADWFLTKPLSISTVSASSSRIIEFIFYVVYLMVAADRLSSFILRLVSEGHMELIVRLPYVSSYGRQGHGLLVHPHQAGVSDSY